MKLFTKILTLLLVLASCRTQAMHGARTSLRTSASSLKTLPWTVKLTPALAITALAYGEYADRRQEAIRQKITLEVEQKKREFQDSIKNAAKITPEDIEQEKPEIK